ncbi:hypothetical protein [Beijerinckia mobilis]|uniref:hypothetical protein n=1 Tax=Beijerinckia mobilis TaxID=231434 RepID=UPI000A8118E6|nr:hypothetical protein [Beijerinckia mobilis]
MAAAQQASSDALSKGLIPYCGAQRWEDSVIASLPAGAVISDESNYPNIASDRAAGTPVASTMDTDPAYVAWAKWIIANADKYCMKMYDGGTYPQSGRTDGYSAFHISMAMPLDAADVPSDLVLTRTNDTTVYYGDVFAYWYGKAAALSGATGVALSDFTDGNPYTADWADFNPRIIARFATLYGYTISGSTIADQATWILQHAGSNWVDFHCTMYSYFFNALAAEIGRNTGLSALVIDQCGSWAQNRRLNGVDGRKIVRTMNSKYYFAGWDCKTIQSDRLGLKAGQHPIRALAGPIIAAAREPYTRNGSNIEALDNTLTQGIKGNYPTMSDSDVSEFATKIVKQIWVSHLWAHICGYYRDFRRAICVVSRDYWDAGDISAITNLQTLVQDICPAKPFGPALYYSVTAERSLENTTLKNGPYEVQYLLDTDDFQTIMNSGKAPIGYFISDAALSKGNLRNGDAAAPSAFLIATHSDLIPSSELSALQAIAPVVTSVDALDALTGQPLKFTGGVCGFGFIAADGRLIIVARHPSAAQNATSITGTIVLNGLVNGSYTATELFTNSTVSVTVSGGTTTISITLSRWDTLVYALPAAAHS